MIKKIRRFYRLHTPLVTYTGLLLIGIVGLVVGIIPSVQKSLVLLRDLRTMSDEIRRIQNKVSVLRSLDQTVLEQYAFDALSAVPSDKSVSTLLSTVEALTDKHGLTIVDMSIQGIGSLATESAKPQVKPEGNMLSETLSLQGDLIPLRNFLIDSIRVRRLLRIKDLVLTALPKSTHMSAKLTIEVFYSLLPLSIGKATDVLLPFTLRETTTLEKIASFPIAYAQNSQAMSPLTPSIIGEEPTSPSVLDPFSLPRSIMTPSPTLSPTPSVIPQATPSPTGQSTVTPTSTQTPQPTP